MYSPDELIEAGAKAIQWCAAHLREDGTFPNAETRILAYYKAPVSFALTGQVLAAGRVSHHIRKTFFEAGDFHKVADDPSAGSFLNYQNCWITRGQHLVGNFDLAYAGADYLEGLIKANGGGLPVGKPGHPVSGQLDMSTTCNGVIAFLTLGRPEAARRAGDFVIDILREQPQADQRIFVRRDADGNLIQDPADDLRALSVIDFSQPKQIYWFLGLALVALGRLHLATGEAKWKETADLVCDYIDRCQPDIFQWITVAKFVWGAAENYSVTGDVRYKNLAERMARWLIGSQDPSGAWLRPGYQSLEVQPLDVTIDTTIERGYYLQEAAKALSVAE